MQIYFAAKKKTLKSVCNFLIKYIFCKYLYLQAHNFCRLWNINVSGKVLEGNIECFFRSMGVFCCRLAYGKVGYLMKIFPSKVCIVWLGFSFTLYNKLRK